MFRSSKRIIELSRVGSYQNNYVAPPLHFFYMKEVRQRDFYVSHPKSTAVSDAARTKNPEMTSSFLSVQKHTCAYTHTHTPHKLFLKIICTSLIFTEISSFIKRHLVYGWPLELNSDTPTCTKALGICKRQNKSFHIRLSRYPKKEKEQDPCLLNQKELNYIDSTEVALFKVSRKGDEEAPG